jgi:UTP--glucose-1-phosphate uridylyltransferase
VITRARKAVIPAAGLGTRFLPATKAQPKEMLPLVDKPAIQYVVEETAAAGIRDILVITGRGKRAIEDHFDRAFELEDELLRRGRHDLLKEVQATAEIADIHYVRQGDALGLGHAVSVARQHVGHESFAVLLGDDVMRAGSTLLQRMLDTHERLGATVLALEAVSPEQIPLYGCVLPEPMEEGIVRVRGLVEKPTAADAPSNLRVVGRYVFTPGIFDALEHLEPSTGGEIQLTDAIDRLRENEPVYGCIFEGGMYDTGNKMGFLRATVEAALDREDLQEEFRGFLSDIARREGLT